MQKSQRIINPIIDWTTEEVWEFIREYNVRYCELYDQGYTRLGCIGCPFATVKSREAEFERYPKYKEAYVRAFDRMLENMRGGGRLEERHSQSGEAMFKKWTEHW